MLRPSFLLPALTLEGPLSPSGKVLWYPPGRTCRGCKLGGAHPRLAWRVGKLGGAHPLPPPMLQHFLGEIACRHGRGDYIL